MNKYDPNIHHRRSKRLKGYDYSREGMYFITICVQHRLCLFGNIKNGEMELNDAGKMIVKWEHIICNEKSHRNISEYIMNNPLYWEIDKMRG